MPTELTQAYLRPFLPQRPADGHKGTFGHLFVLAGSRGFTGAAKLACEGAGRSGVGLVTLGIPYPLADIVEAALLETMSISLPATKEETLSPAGLKTALNFAMDKKAVALGPGLSQHAKTQTFIQDFVAECSVPLVIDADALNALSEDLEAFEERQAPCIVTPHPGEMARLANLTTKDVQRNREIVAKDFAKRFDCTVLLKGKGTIIANELGDCYVCPTGNSGMATGGSGDVLTGFIGGLVAQGMTCFNAGLAGAYLHGLAGDFAARALTERAMRARDLLTYLPGAWRALEGTPEP